MLELAAAAKRVGRHRAHFGCWQDGWRRTYRRSRAWFLEKSFVIAKVRLAVRGSLRKSGHHHPIARNSGARRGPRSSGRSIGKSTAKPKAQRSRVRG